MPERRRAAVLLGLALLAAGLLAGCSGESPLCDQGEQYVAAAKLREAAEAYAEADRRDRESCGRSGLDKVRKLQAQAITGAAAGSAAEKSGDLRAAQAAYEAVLKIEQGNAEAQAGLNRVTRRPSTIDRVWLRAQRLHDEGYDVEARKEVIAVLRQHPDLVVPRSLAQLRTLPTATPAARPTASAEPAAGPAARTTLLWIVLAVLGAVLLAALVVGGLTIRELHARLSAARQSTSDRVEDVRARAEAGRAAGEQASVHVAAALQSARNELQDVDRGLRQAATAAQVELSDLRATVTTLTETLASLDDAVTLLDIRMDGAHAALRARAETDSVVERQRYANPDHEEEPERCRRSPHGCDPVLAGRPAGGPATRRGPACIPHRILGLGPGVRAGDLPLPTAPARAGLEPARPWAVGR